MPDGDLLVWRLVAAELHRHKAIDLGLVTELRIEGGSGYGLLVIGSSEWVKVLH